MFIPHTESEREEMLRSIGVEKIEDLFTAIPEQHRFPKLDMLHGMTEMEASAQLKEMAEANLSLSNISQIRHNELHGYRSRLRHARRL